MNGDWLDRLARRSVGGVQAPASDPDEERYSRATAVKLAAAGVASVSLGLWRAPPATALDKGQCFKECGTRLDQFEDNWASACFDKFGASRKWVDKTPAWKQALLLVTLPGTMVQAGLAANCAMLGLAVGQQAREQCWRNCERTCGKAQSRSAQASRQVCEPTPPPKNHTPAQPPPPDMTADPCLACNQVGGLCCGPFKSNPDGSFQPCACANPDIGCARYGCG